MRPILFRIRRKGYLFLRKREADLHRGLIIVLYERRYSSHILLPIEDSPKWSDTIMHPNRISSPCLQGYDGAPSPTNLASATRVLELSTPFRSSPRSSRNPAYTWVLYLSSIFVGRKVGATMANKVYACWRIASRGIKLIDTPFCTFVFKKLEFLIIRSQFGIFDG